MSLRFYFDDLQRRCLPFESRSCEENYFSFDSLRGCEESCVTIYPGNYIYEYFMHSCPFYNLRKRVGVGLIEAETIIIGIFTGRPVSIGH